MFAYVAIVSFVGDGPRTAVRTTEFNFAILLYVGKSC